MNSKLTRLQKNNILKVPSNQTSDSGNVCKNDKMNGKKKKKRGLTKHSRILKVPVAKHILLLFSGSSLITCTSMIHVWIEACLFFQSQFCEHNCQANLSLGFGLEDLDSLPREIWVFTSKMTISSSLLVPEVTTSLQVKVDSNHSWPKVKGLLDES